jgi:hypothetical protein
MKDWLKQHLREGLKEVEQKKIFGSGNFHNVYSSKKNPDRLYKIGHERNVYEWVDIFNDYPEFFPKIYRVFPYSKDPEYTVVEIEKLDTSKAKLDYKIVEDFLEDNSDRLQCNGEFITTSNFFEEPCFDSVISLAEEYNDPNLTMLLEKWGEYIGTIYNIVRKNMGRNLDLHYGNVAYDKDGNIKMIDI